MVINMSMNKIKYILLFILSFLLININVYADETCGTWTQSGKEICEQKEYNGKKCVFNTKDICYINSQVDSNENSDKPCSEYANSKSECEAHSYNGKKCGFMANVNICEPISNSAEKQTCSQYSKQTDCESNSMCQWGDTTLNVDYKENHCICGERVCSNFQRSTCTNLKTKSDCESKSYCKFTSLCVAKNSATNKKDTKSDDLPSATEWKTVECVNLNEENCKKRQDCKLVGGTCKKSQEADDPCNEQSIRKTFRFFGYLLMIAKFMVPLIIIGFATIDLYKALVDKDEKSLNKKLRMVGIRILTGIIVFFMPTIVSAFLGLSEKTSIKDNEQYKICAECILEPTKKNLCTIDD